MKKLSRTTLALFTPIKEVHAPYYQYVIVYNDKDGSFDIAERQESGVYGRTNDIGLAIEIEVTHWLDFSKLKKL